MPLTPPLGAQNSDEEERDTAAAAALERRDDPQTWSETEREALLRLPRKEYLLTAQQTRRALFGLVDILVATCYDLRVTQGEGTVESGWTIAKLSATLSWCDRFDSVCAAYSLSSTPLPPSPPSRCALH